MRHADDAVPPERKLGTLPIRRGCAACHNTGVVIRASRGFFPDDPPRGTLYQAFCDCDAGIDAWDAAVADPAFRVVPAACTLCAGTGTRTLSAPPTWVTKGETYAVYCPCIMGDVRCERENRS